MTPGDRKRMLDALGLVDWQPRADRMPVGAGAKRAAVAHGTAHTPAEDAPPAVPEAAAPATQDTAPKPPVATTRQAPAAAHATAGDDGHDTPDAMVDMPAGEAGAENAADDVSRMGWEELEAWLAGRDHRGATRPVFGIGARDADVLIVGEAPGANEDAQGVPFVGRAGKLLDRMLAAIGCSRDTNVYITNICKFRPPNNRDPNADEVAADWPVLERQIELMDPKLVVAVGRVAAQTLLDSKQSLGKLRGTLHRYPRRELDVLVTYHPAFLLRSPGQKAKAWVDLKQIARRISER